MNEPKWVKTEWLAVFHHDQIQQHGGTHGVRDQGLIDSAMERPKHRFHYDSEADLFDLAATYAHGLAKNHGYVDGNKRIAYVVMNVFLQMNGYELTQIGPENVVVMSEVASGARSEDDLASWLREHCEPRT